MPVEVKFEEQELAGFSDPAKTRLNKSVRDFGGRLIAEANRLEAGHNTSSSNREVTHSMVEAATTLLNHGASPRVRSKRKTLLTILSQALPLALGLSWDAKKLTDLWYVALIFILFGAALVCIIFANLED